jgi:transposase
MEEISLGKARFGLPDGVAVMSSYEAGRDGFWLHRFLNVQGVRNMVEDSASIGVNRRKRRAKTDRMDVGKLLIMLIRSAQGERKVWSVVNPPSPEEEDQRQLHRDLMALKRERTHHINHIKGLLVLRSKRSSLVLALRRNTLSSWATIGINQVYIYAQLHWPVRGRN